MYTKSTNNCCLNDKNNDDNLSSSNTKIMEILSDNKNTTLPLEDICTNKQIIKKDEKSSLNNQNELNKISAINSFKLGKKLNKVQIGENSELSTENVFNLSSNSNLIDSFDNCENTKNNRRINKNIELTITEIEINENSCEIIDGIMFYNFETEEELNQLTEKHLKEIQEKNELETCLKKSKTLRNKSIKNKLFSTSSQSKKLDKSKNSNVQVDSTFISNELDDYLNKHNKQKSCNYSLSLDENLFKFSLNKTINSQESNRTKRKTCINVQYSYDSEDFDEYDNQDKTCSLLNKCLADSNDSSISINSQNRNISSNLNKRNQSRTKTRGRPKKNSFILTNQINLDLIEDENINLALIDCLKNSRKVCEAQIKIFNNMLKSTFIDEPLTTHALFSLENFCVRDICNKNEKIDNKNSNKIEKIDIDKKFIENNIFKIVDSKKASSIRKIENRETFTEIDASKIKNNLKSFFVKNTENSFTDKKIKPELDEQILVNLNNEQNLGLITKIEKQTNSSKRKFKNNEDDFDIARYISKHSKRDIRLPVRYHHSGLLIGSQWMIPNLEEEKNKISNINKDNKISPNKLINKKSSNVYDCSLSNESKISKESFDTLDKNDLFNKSSKQLKKNNSDSSCVESEKSLILKKSKSNLLSGQKKIPLIKDKEQKLSMLKELYRSLFYANRPLRLEYYSQKLIKPRVNKIEVIEEGIATIDLLHKQKKKLSYAQNLLLLWNNKLKLCIKFIEESKGDFSKVNIENATNTISSYCNKITPRVTHLMQTVKELDNQLNSNISDIITTNFSSDKVNTKIDVLSTVKTKNVSSEIAYLDKTNVPNRVINLKQKSNKSAISKNNFIKNNQNSNNSLSSKLNKQIPTNGINSIQKDKHLINFNPSNNMPNNIINLEKNRFISTNNKNLTQFQNLNNYFPQHSNDNGILTLKFSGTGLQIPYSYTMPDLSLTNQALHATGSLNSLMSNNTSQIVNNNLPQTSQSFVNYCIKDKFITLNPPALNQPLNYIKAPETITNSHFSDINSKANSSLIQSQINNIQTQPYVKNFHKILPKYSNSNIKMKSVTFVSPNLQIMPSSQNVVISPLNSITSLPPTPPVSTNFTTSKNFLIKKNGNI